MKDFLASVRTKKYVGDARPAFPKTQIKSRWIWRKKNFVLKAISRSLSHHTGLKQKNRRMWKNHQWVLKKRPYFLGSSVGWLSKAYRHKRFEPDQVPILSRITR